MSDQKILWGDEKHLTVLPDATPVPSAILDGAHTQNKERSAVVSLDLRDKVPYKPVLSSDLKTLTVRLYYTISNLDRIRYDTAGGTAFLRQVRWSQPEKETTDIQIEAKEKIWGYELKYDGGRLFCEIFFMPKLKKSWNPWSELTIAVDPGHSQMTGDGAVSPKGFKEGEVNYRISECLKRKLEKLGAKVFMTREIQEYVSLPDRGKRAIAAGADLFISVHTNAVPDGVNPMTRGGFSVFYFQPNGLDLARAVHDEFKKTVKLNDDGFYYGNLAVCRVTRIPSILTESAFLIRPDEEELLLDPGFQCRCAEAIARGVQNFIKSY